MAKSVKVTRNPDEDNDENREDFNLLKRQLTKTIHKDSSVSDSMGLQASGSLISTDETELWPLYLKCTIVRQYIFGDIVGRGSYAEVRECINTKNLERCAVKIVDRNYLKRQNPRALKNQMLELKLLRQLHHENVIKLKEILFEDSRIYIFLEYCNFVMHDLLADLPNNRMCTPLARNLFHQLLRGLQYLHSIPIIHRDIKPQNLLINIEGTLKIIDFGVSHHGSIWADKVMCTNYEGSPMFQAPEVIICEDQYSGSKVDVWSAGVTLCLMVFGRYPFYDETLLGLYDRILGEEFKIPQRFNYHGHRLILGDYMARMLDKNPATRSTIDELLVHPWLAFNRDNLDCSDDHNDHSTEHFPSGRVEESMHHFISNGSIQSRDIYRSTSCLPYLYTYHFPDHRATKPSTPAQSESRSTTPTTPDSSDALVFNEFDIDDRPVEWGTEKQFKLLKVPHVRVNRTGFEAKKPLIRHRKRA